MDKCKNISSILKFSQVKSFRTSYGRKVNRRSGRGPINFLDEMNIKQSLVSCYTSSIFIMKRYTRCKHCIYLTNCATFSDDRSIIGALVPLKTNIPLLSNQPFNPLVSLYCTLRTIFILLLQSLCQAQLYHTFQISNN